MTKLYDALKMRLRKFTFRTNNCLGTLHETQTMNMCSNMYELLLGAD